MIVNPHIMCTLTPTMSIVTGFRFRARADLLGDQAAEHPSNKDQRKCARSRQSFIRLINCRELLVSTIRMNLQPISSNILN